MSTKSTLSPAGLCQPELRQRQSPGRMAYRPGTYLHRLTATGAEVELSGGQKCPADDHLVLSSEDPCAAAALLYRLL